MPRQDKTATPWPKGEKGVRWRPINPRLKDEYLALRQRKDEAEEELEKARECLERVRFPLRFRMSGTSNLLSLLHRNRNSHAPLTRTRGKRKFHNTLLIERWRTQKRAFEAALKSYEIAWENFNSMQSRPDLKNHLLEGEIREIAFKLKSPRLFGSTIMPAIEEAAGTYLFTSQIKKPGPAQTQQAMDALMKLAVPLWDFLYNDLDVFSRKELGRFIDYHKTMRCVKDLEAAAMVVRRKTPKSKGGRRTMTHLNNLIHDLANIFIKIGLKPWHHKPKFKQFVRMILDIIDPNIEERENTTSEAIDKRIYRIISNIKNHFLQKNNHA